MGKTYGSRHSHLHACTVYAYTFPFTCMHLHSLHIAWVHIKSAGATRPSQVLHWATIHTLLSPGYTLSQQKPPSSQAGADLLLLPLLLLLLFSKCSAANSGTPPWPRGYIWSSSSSSSVPSSASGRVNSILIRSAGGQSQRTAADLRSF